MARIQYEIETYPVRDFRQLAFVCSSSGECEVKDIPADQIEILSRKLNARGVDGWELVQMSFGAELAVAIFKKILDR